VSHLTTLKTKGGRLPLWAYLAGAAALSALCLIVYSPALKAPFYFDDYLYIVGNPKIRALSNFWPPYGSRYLAFLSFALNHRFGGLNPPGYHLANIVIHILNSILVFILTALTLRTPAALRGQTAWSGRPLFAASLAVSAIFAVHPVQTQAVTYVSQRFVLIASFFYLASIVSFVKWRLRQCGGGAGGRGGGPSHYAHYAVSLLSAVLAQFSKEISFTLPAVILFYEFTFFEGLGGLKRKLPFFIPFLLVFAIIPFSILTPFAGKIAGYDTVEHILKGGQTLDLETYSPYEYLLTQFRVIVTYLRLIVFPAWQNFHYDFPRFSTLLDIRVLPSFAFLAIILALNAFLYLRSRKASVFLLTSASFGVFWFFITLSVESSFIPIKDVIFEHRLYLPSVGFTSAFVSFALYASGSREGPGKGPVSYAAPALFLIAVITLSFTAYKRNLVWSDKTALYEDMAEKSARLPRAHLLLANEYKDSGRFEDAMREYRTAISLDPAYASAYNNLGALHFLSGNAPEALAMYRKALELDPGISGIHYNIGLAYDRLALLDEAIKHYETSLKVQPEFVAVHYHLGVDYLRKGMISSGKDEIELFVTLAPPAYAPEVAEARMLLERLKGKR